MPPLRRNEGEAGERGEDRGLETGEAAGESTALGLRTMTGLGLSHLRRTMMYRGPSFSLQGIRDSSCTSYGGLLSMLQASRRRFEECVSMHNQLGDAEGAQTVHVDLAQD